MTTPVDESISSLPIIPSAQFTDFFPSVQAGITYQENLLQVATLFGFNASHILSVLSGGTGVGSVTTTPTAASFAGWDANKNISANNFLDGYTSTVTSGATTILNVSSTFDQYFTGTMTHTIVLPVVSTLVLGQSFYIANNSTSSITVNSSGGNNVEIMLAGTTLLVTCILTSGTTAASWAKNYNLQNVLSLPLAISQGGTSVSSVTTSPTANAWAGWDNNENLSADNILLGYTTTATTGGNTTLTVASDYYQYFTGTTTESVNLPVVSTLVLGQSYFIVNNSTGVVTVFSSGGNTIQAMAPNTVLLVTCILTSGTTAASWSSFYNIESALTLPLSLANGGTNSNISASPGSIAYGTASAIALNIPGSAGQLSQSTGAGAPSWTTPTYPTGSGAAGQILRSDGTNNDYSTASYPDVTTINQLLYSSSNNTVSGLSTNNNSVLVTSGGGIPSLSTTLPSGLTIPGYQTTITPAALTSANDTNVTLTLGGTPATALLQGVSITAGWANQLSLARGGTNANLTASNGGIVYSTASAFGILAGTPTAGQLVTSGSSTTPTWTTSTYPLTNAINTLLYASSANTMAALATANSGTLVTSNTGVPSISSTLPIAVQTNITQLGTVTVGTWNASTISATYGGSGVSNPTAHGILVAEGSSAFNPITLANGQLLLGSTGADPVAAAPTNGTNISWTTGAGSLTANLTGIVSPTLGGTGVSNPTAHGIMVSEGSSAVNPITLTNGQLLIGSTGADPSAATLTSGNVNTVITNAAGSITISALGILIPNDVTGTSTTMVVNNSYIADNAGLVTLTLPTTSAQGSEIVVIGKGAGGWKIAQNAGQSIHITNSTTTVGTGGSLANGNNINNSLRMLCTVANTTWNVYAFTGTLTVV